MRPPAHLFSTHILFDILNIELSHSFHAEFLGLYFRYYLLVLGQVREEIIDRGVYLGVRALDSPEQLDT